MYYLDVEKSKKSLLIRNEIIEKLLVSRYDFDKEKIILVATYSLVAVVSSMIVMFIWAVVDPNVDDKIVFDIIGPAFQTIVGGFIGLITGIHIGEKKDDNAE